MTTPISTDILSSWKEIAQYLKSGVRTVQRWESQFGLPVRRLGCKHRSHVMAMRSEIDDWLKADPPQKQSATPTPGTLSPYPGTISFFRVEIQSGLTFATLAMTADPADNEKIKRNLYNAQKAYDTVIKFRSRFILSEGDAAELDAGIERLKAVLQARGG